jgi:hypothetical protein
MWEKYSKGRHHNNRISIIHHIQYDTSEKIFYKDKI